MPFQQLHVCDLWYPAGEILLCVWVPDLEGNPYFTWGPGKPSNPGCPSLPTRPAMPFGPGIPGNPGFPCKGTFRLHQWKTKISKTHKKKVTTTLLPRWNDWLVLLIPLKINTLCSYFLSIALLLADHMVQCHHVMVNQTRAETLVKNEYVMLLFLLDVQACSLGMINKSITVLFTLYSTAYCVYAPLYVFAFNFCYIQFCLCARIVGCFPVSVSLGSTRTLFPLRNQ